MSDLINFDVQINGLDELDDKLKELSAKTQRKTLEGALMKAALPIMKDAKKLAPEDSGDLKKAIGRTRVKKAEHPSVTVEVKKRRNKPWPWYWHFIEHGTSRTAAAPFLRPAFERNVQLAIDLFSEDLAKRIDKLTQD